MSFSENLRAIGRDDVSQTHALFSIISCAPSCSPDPFYRANMYPVMWRVNAHQRPRAPETGCGRLLGAVNLLC